MPKYFYVSPFLLCGVILSGCAATQVPLPNLETSSELSLVWADEFEGDRLDRTRWAFDQHRNRAGWYNNERQYYGPDNVRVEDGQLHIDIRQERPSGASDDGGQTYTSARLHTKGLAAWQYGRVEARVKVPCGTGLWPAVWMLPEAGGKWPDGGEIDIMEYVGFQPDTFHATVHTRDYNHAQGTEVGAKIDQPGACDRFHTHRLDWTADAITVSLDDTPYFTYLNDGAGPGSWPFDQPFHLLLNVAVGGDWGGREGIDPEIFPATMSVDYVRIYQ
ncbi:glycoside hydrolase family 16 protein [Litorimonas sp. WD9-15]|uniref:glycoside hydrolase family 16 protein n=1 Tax=Litorimonas sp. WD9-15 TaxID=3418716 RepID=UPI003D06E89A